MDHSKLKISFAELGALLGTRAMLANKVIVDAKGINEPQKNKHSFNMGAVCNVARCGSVACIGGTMGQIMGIDAFSYVLRKDTLGAPISNLFFPPQKYDFSKITPAQAIKAIDNFLATGNPLWSKILPKKLIEK